MRKKGEKNIRCAGKIAIRAMKTIFTPLFLKVNSPPSNLLTSLPIASLLSLIRSAIIPSCAGATLFEEQRGSAQELIEEVQFRARRKR
jgi:hypothetical protein